jgi:hypothetical protein
MKITYTIRDTARPDDELIIDLAVDEEDDPDGLAPWADVDNVDELLNWWSDPKGRGYITLEDGYGQVLVDASSGEPNIMVWPDIDDERFELEYFPFPSLSFEVTQ